ncbi:MAG TPA: PspA/IM30 family protein [Candidatus Dormibacteraeota bacterium]|nr:PspA/IM30 family protein [Candidatus Dormibacteraeota bacterium]
MRFLARLKAVLAQGASVALAPAPDPRVTNLTSHQKQRALLDQVIRAGQEVTAAKLRLQVTADAIRQKLPAMEEQARQELRAGNEAMARLALQRRQVVAHELETLERQLAEVEKEESALAVIEQRLTGQIEAFAARQEVVRARYSAAEAQVRINEAMTGVSQDFAELTATLQRAEQTTSDMEARATAIDRLVHEGDMETIGFAAGSDAIDARYQTLGADEDVERRLRALRELG